MSKKIILSADQSCDIGPVLQETFGVEFVPTTIILEDREYIDNETITADDIYRAYWDRKVLPKTTAINMAEYLQKFEPWFGTDTKWSMWRWAARCPRPTATPCSRRRSWAAYM